jgi:hypothetical protein
MKAILVLGDLTPLGAAVHYCWNYFEVLLSITQVSKINNNVHCPHRILGLRGSYSIFLNLFVVVCMCLWLHIVSLGINVQAAVVTYSTLTDQYVLPGTFYVYTFLK